ncbi:G8 domain-containing protein [Maribacter sp. 2-571]|uniref:G8 domain-containing protein n=1 Tax=Maribacter sp. 2-571 TaxID=3417569 RepID=UPI003D33C540
MIARYKPFNIILVLLLWLTTSLVAVHGQHKGKTLFSKADGKQQDTVIVPFGKTRILTKNTATVGKLIVRGTLKVDDSKDIALFANHIAIDGGTLQVGTKETPFKHRFSIRFTPSIDQKPSELKAINGGRLLLYGTSLKNGAKSESDQDSKNAISTSQRSITIGSDTEKHRFTVLIADAGAVEISGMHIQGAGIQDTVPALSWFGDTEVPSYIEKSVFSNSEHTALLLDKTTVRVAENSFHYGKAHAVVCSPSGIGSENKIIGNTIYNNSQGIFAVRINNPYQTFAENGLHLANGTKGIGILKPDGYEHFIWKKDAKNFHFATNTISGITKKDTAITVGVQIGNFEHSGIWRSHQNIIENCAIGLWNQSKNLVLDRYVFKNNTIGLSPGAAYVQHCVLSNDTKQPASTALQIVSKNGISEPKLTNVQIVNYAVGMHIEGAVSEHNYFEKIVYDHVAEPLRFKNLSKESVLYDKDRSLTRSPLPEMVARPSKKEGHHHGGGKNKHKGCYLFPSNSNLATKNSTPLPGDPSIQIAPVSQFGTLTIATGFGLEDPVHEHRQQLQTLNIEHLETHRRWMKKEVLDNESFFLPSDGGYTLAYGTTDTDLYDLSFEWEAPETSWIMIKMAYPYPTVKGLRSFGSLIPPTESLHALMHENKTGYFYEAHTETAYVKIYNEGNRDELVVYSSDVLTEIRVDGKKIPLSIYRDAKKDAIVIAYELPKKMASTLVLTDNFGNVLKTLHDSDSDIGKIAKELDLTGFDFENDNYFYFLTIDDQTHKGPVYRY